MVLVALEQDSYLVVCVSVMFMGTSMAGATYTAHLWCRYPWTEKRRFFRVKMLTLG